MYNIPQGVGIGISLLKHELEKIRKHKLVIALDGHSSSGKSTLAHNLAQLLSLNHIDTGAMYRAVTLYLLNNDIDITDKDKVSSILKKIDISFQREKDRCITMLNGQKVEEEIRTMRVSDHVSDVSTISAVRSHLVQLQRKMAASDSVIMDGRDIGSVVLPDANVKIFVSASLEIRTERRYQELLDKGVNITKEEVAENLAKRDYIDSNREDSPLIQAEDAILLDTSSLDQGQMLAEAVKIIHSKTVS